MRHEKLTEAAQYRRALATLDELGWVQGIMRSAYGVCLVGALSYTPSGKYLGLDEPIPMLACVIRERYPDRVHPITGVFTRFNDHPDTTEEDVRLVLKDALERCSS